MQPNEVLYKVYIKEMSTDMLSESNLPQFLQKELQTDTVQKQSELFEIYSNIFTAGLFLGNMSRSKVTYSRVKQLLDANRVNELQQCQQMEKETLPMSLKAQNIMNVYQRLRREFPDKEILDLKEKVFIQQLELEDMVERNNDVISKLKKTVEEQKLDLQQANQERLQKTINQMKEDYEDLKKDNEVLRSQVDPLLQGVKDQQVQEAQVVNQGMQAQQQQMQPNQWQFASWGAQPNIPQESNQVNQRDLDEKASEELAKQLYEIEKNLAQKDLIQSSQEEVKKVDDMSQKLENMSNLLNNL